MNTRSARRLAWGLAGTTLVLGVAGIAIGLANGTVPGAEDVIFIVYTLVFAILGTLLASRRPENAVGWIFLGLAVFVTLVGTLEGVMDRIAAGDPTSLPARLREWTSGWTWVPFILVPTTFPLLLFPDGHPPSPRWRWIVWGAAIGIPAFSFSMAFDPENYGGRIPIGIEPPEVLVQVAGFAGLLSLTAVVGGVIAVVVRFRRAAGEERQQLKWLAFAGLVAGFCLVGGFVAGAILSAFGVVSTTSNNAIDQILNGVILLGILGLPIGMAVSILKYHLYDIDVVIRKTVVFGILVLLIMSVAIGLFLVASGPLTDLASDETQAVGVAGLVLGFLIWPLYRLSRRIAERVVFRGRSSPYEVLTEFSERMSVAYATDDVLPRLAAVLREGTGAESAVVWLRIGNELRPEAVWPSDAKSLMDLPEDAVEVVHQGEQLGALSVEMPANDPMNPTKREVVRSLAAQAGLVLRNVLLIEELRESRRRIVAAQDEERRRIERNIHDGAQQQLVALAVKQRLTASFVGKDDERVRIALEELQAETNDALENLRDLARGIYPPLLADEGLAAAIESQARKAAIPVTVEPDGIGRYPQEVESAVYFSVLEALQNVAKYAEASRADVELTQDDSELIFTVTDDGRGFDVNLVARGAGMHGMEDRIAAIGGRLEVRSTPESGTTVAGRVPATERKEGT